MSVHVVVNSPEYSAVVKDLIRGIVDDGCPSGPAVTFHFGSGSYGRLGPSTAGCLGDVAGGGACVGENGPDVGRLCNGRVGVFIEEGDVGVSRQPGTASVVGETAEENAGCGVCVQPVRVDSDGLRGGVDTHGHVQQGLSNHLPSLAYGRLPRGPNYERNQANRLRKRMAKELRRESDSVGRSAHVGRFDGLPEEKRTELVETQAERLLMENKARIQSLKDREGKRARGAFHLAEAVELLKVARECSGLVGAGAKASRVAGWASTVASDLSESIARASSIGSYGSGASEDSGVSANSSASLAFLGLKRLPLSRTETWLQENCQWDDSMIVCYRQKLGRALAVEDCVGDDPVILVGREKLLQMMADFSGGTKEELIARVTAVQSAPVADGVVVRPSVGVIPTLARSIATSRVRHAGKTYSRAEAVAFVGRYCHIAARLVSNMTDGEVAAASTISVAEVKKLRALKAAFLI